MRFTDDQTESLLESYDDVLSNLSDLILQCVAQGEAVAKPRAREYLVHGAARRIGILRRCVQNIFEQFPPSLERPLATDVLYDVQINLQVFVLNLYGIFENWAWAFVFRHDLEDDIGSRKNVGLFKKETQRFLPLTLRRYLTSETMVVWHGEYLTAYRDALAHRIPLYVPPADWTKEDSERYVQLETEKHQCMRTREWNRIAAIRAEQASIGAPSLQFVHSFSDEEASRPLLRHPQIITDSMTVVDFGEKFLEDWSDCVRRPQ